jgi:hypothetical protein
VEQGTSVRSHDHDWKHNVGELLDAYKVNFTLGDDLTPTCQFFPLGRGQYSSLLAQNNPKVQTYVNTSGHNTS